MTHIPIREFRRLTSGSKLLTAGWIDLPTDVDSQLHMTYWLPYQQVIPKAVNKKLFTRQEGPRLQVDNKYLTDDIEKWEMNV